MNAAFAGTFSIRYEKEFHGALFRDNEIAHVYVLERDVDAGRLALQTDEVERVGNMNVSYVYQDEALGLGHAVRCAAEKTGNEAFYVLLGDVLVLVLIRSASSV